MGHELRFTFEAEPETVVADQDDEHIDALSQDSDDDLDMLSGDERVLKVRLDKWLWAARFFKTRPLARAAVENGKVFYNGQRSKPSREIEVGAVLQIRHGRHEKTVVVKGLSTRRRSTEEAFQLFEETEESKELREQCSEFQQQPVNSTPYRLQRDPFIPSPTTYPNPDLQQPRERRAVRFLRRSFHRGEQQVSQPRSNDSAPPASRYYEQQPRYNHSYNGPRYNQQDQQQPRYSNHASRYDEQQPLYNDNLPPFSPFRNAPKQPQTPWEFEKSD